MRYLVFGDVHANLVALEAVLQAAEERQVDAFLFVGDLVGYGPCPLECIRRLAPLVAYQRLAWVAGNHDLAVRGESDMERFSAEARETLAWTRRLVEAEPAARAFMAGAPVISKIQGGIWLTHDSLADPGSGQYHRATENAKVELAQLAQRQGRICFYGHTHTLRAEITTAESVLLMPLVPHTGAGRDAAPLELNEGERAWVGCGSVGFPTRQKGQAEYLVLDDARWSLEKYAAAFSREAAKARVHEILGPACRPAVTERIARWL